MIQCETKAGTFWKLPANRDVTEEICRLSSTLTKHQEENARLVKAIESIKSGLYAADFSKATEFAELKECYFMATVGLPYDPDAESHTAEEFAHMQHARTALGVE